MDFKFTRENLLKLVKIGVAGALFFLLLFTPDSIQTIIAFGLIVLELMSIKTEKFIAPSKAWLLDHIARSDDGKEFGLAMISAIPGENIETEPVRNYEGKEAWLYFIKNDRNTRRYGNHKLKGTIDLVLGDPGIPSMQFSGMIANFHTTVEWRDISEFRSYARKIFKESGKANLADIFAEIDEDEFKQISKYYHQKEEDRPRNVNVTNNVPQQR